MKIPVLLIVGLVLISCNKETKKDKQRCVDVMDFITSETFEGLIYLCNGDPDVTYLDAKATVKNVRCDQIEIHLISDNSLIDTTLYFNTTCLNYQKRASLTFTDNQGNAGGALHSGSSSSRLTVPFDYRDCLDNTHFEGHNK